MTGWTRNPGRLPEEAKGKRVGLKLANGSVIEGSVNATNPPGWAADGANRCRWSITGQPFDIVEYRVL